MKKNNINNTIKEIESLSKLLKEAYIFDGNEEETPMEEPKECEVPQEEVPDEEVMQDGGTDEIVDQIRQLALDGIQKYADDVDNEMYILFKKVWMMCDKCLSEKDKVEG